MFKKIKNFFKTANNERGSTLTMTIIVIAVLSFTVTTVTAASINLSGQVTHELDQANDESVAKALITQSISDLEDFVNNGGSFPDFNSNEIGRIYNDYQVIVNDVTSEYPDFDDSGTGDTISKVYKFSYALDNGNTLVKYAYLSSAGTSLDSPHPFSFSLGTNGDLILNGGYYDEIDLFGNNIYFSKTAPWYENDDINSHLQTPAGNGSYPDIEDGNDKSFVFYTNEYLYCNDDDCFDVTNDGNPYVINKDEYVDVDENELEIGLIQEDNITDFFTNFNFDGYLDERVAHDFPNGNRVISTTLTYENFYDTIIDNTGDIEYKKNGKVKSYPNKAYYDITNDPNYDFQDDNVKLGISAVVDGDLTINHDVEISDTEGEALIVLGNLTINNPDDKEIKIKGNIIVLGNLNIIGNDIEFLRATLIVLGKTDITMNDGEGIETDSNQIDFSLIGRETIFINSVYETNSNNNVPEFYAFIYSEQSIWIDAVNSKLEMRAAIYARALGNSDYPIFMEDELGNQINGIVINSYRGYPMTFLGFPIYLPSSNINNNGLFLERISDKKFTKKFLNFPDFENTTVTEGDVSIDTSEWIYE